MLWCVGDRSSDTMLDMINSLQSERIDSQRAELRPAQKATGKEPGPGTSLPGLRAQHTTHSKPEDDFLEMIARVQGSRLEDQRTELPRPRPEPAKPRPRQENKGTLPDDDFFSLLMRAQGGRMEDQRAAVTISWYLIFFNGRLHS